MTVSSAATALATPSLHDPSSGEPLVRRELCEGAALLTAAGDATRVWPEVDGIPYLRLGREELVGRVVGLLREFDVAHARAELLRDQDDFARQPPPSVDTALEISRHPPATFREAMAALEYGPVAHYFAHRTSTPTFLSGLALLSASGATLLEVCCGAGHFLRFAERRAKTKTTGVDVVWSKLWLARRYMEVQGKLVCCDAVAGSLPFADEAFSTSLCHDALYFLPDKPAVLAELRRVSHRRLIGHAHNRLADHGDVAGTPLAPAEYAAIAAERAELFDDAALTAACLGRDERLRSVAPDEATTLDVCEAIAWVEESDELAGVERGVGDPLDAWYAYRGEGIDTHRLALNPLLVECDGRLAPDWPEERFAVEYAAADYLTGPVPTAEQIAMAASGDWAHDAAMRDFVRRRTFVDLPERW